MIQKPVLTVRLTEAAARLRVTYQTAHRYVLTGVLRGELHNGRWRVDAEDLDRLINRLAAETSRERQRSERRSSHGR
jgi:predicted site-specific integrase-resolvase